MQCSKCQATIAAGAKFCPKCGARAETPAAEIGGKRCPQCGTENPANAKFCQKDGYRFDAVAVKPEASASTVAPPPNEPKAQEAASNPIPVASDSVTCPKCGTANALTAKFCKKDGYPLQAVGAIPSSTPAPKSSPPADSLAMDSGISPSTPPVATLPGEPKVQEAASKPIPPAVDSVTCPKCGTANVPTAKFCKKDGYPMQAAGVVAAPTTVPPQVVVPPVVPAAKPAVMASPVPPTAPKPAPQPVPAIQSAPAAPRPVVSAPPSAPAKPAAAKSRKGMMIGAAVGAAILASTGGGYAYWAGYVGNRQGSVQNEINAELGTHGLSNVKVTVNHEWVASLSGTVLNQADKEEALALLKGHTELKQLVDTVQIESSVADVEKNLNKALAGAGFSSVPTAQLDTDLMATLHGSANSLEEKDRMLALAKGVAGVKGIRDEIEVAAPETLPEPKNSDLAAAEPPAASTPLPPQAAPRQVVDRAALDRELNARLRANGVGSVTGRVNPDMSVALSGTVRSAGERNRALTIGGSLPGANGVRETIQIAAPQVDRLAPPQAPPQAAPPAPPPQAAAIDPAKLEGDINRALRSRDINSITAQVNDDMSLTLKGSASAAEKERAMQLARQVRGIRGVKDKIFVVED